MTKVLVRMAQTPKLQCGSKHKNVSPNLSIMRRKVHFFYFCAGGTPFVSATVRNTETSPTFRSVRPIDGSADDFLFLDGGVGRSESRESEIAVCAELDHHDVLTGSHRAFF